MAAPAERGHLIPAAQLPIEVRGPLTDREFLDGLRVVERRMGRRWIRPVVCLGGPALIVILQVIAGKSLKIALFQNVFWIVFGLLLFFGLPLQVRFGLRSFLKDNPGLGDPQVYRFTDAGVEIRGGPYEVNIAWASILEAVETRAVFLLFTGRTIAHYVPRGPVAATGQLEAVRGVLRERLGERAHLLPASEQPATVTP